MNQLVKLPVPAAAKLAVLLGLFVLGPVACKTAQKEPTGPVPTEAAGPAEPSAPASPSAAKPASAGEAAPAPAAGAADPEAAANDGPPPDDQAGMGVVLASKLNVRKSTVLTPQNVTGSLRCGDVVHIKGKEGDWYKVELKEELRGYAHSSYIVRMRPGGRSPRCEFSFAKKPPAAPGNGDKPLPTTAQRNRDAAEVKEGTAAPEVASPAPPVKGMAGSNKQPAAAAPAVRPTPPDPAPNTAALPVDKGPSKITLAGAEDGAKPVLFPHQFHQKRYDCVKCHHPVATSNGGLTRAKSGDANSNKKCRSCHTTQGSAQIRPTSKDVFHLMCRDCHSVVGGSAPTGCPQCHK